MTRARIALALVLLAGCSGKPTPAPPPKETVEGKVVSRGRPVPYVMVMFHPQDLADTNRYDGLAGKDGEFTLQCPKGHYKVTINPLPSGPGGDAGRGGLVGSPDAKGLKEMPARYLDKAQTTLTADVPEGGKKGVTLEVR